jgi:MYXO-CTERM domain-containing protein
MDLAHKKGLLVAVIAITPTAAHAICRVVVQEGSPPPVVDPAQSVLMIHRSQVPVGKDCSPLPPNMSMPDLGSIGDDAGTELADLSGSMGASMDLSAVWDASSPGDLLSLDDDGGALCDPSGDGGACADLGPPPADMATVCRDRLGEAITMVVQPQFSTGVAGSNFAMLMATPKVPTVALAPASLFHDLAVATAPKVTNVEMDVEDPALGCKSSDPKYGSSSSSIGCGGDPGGTSDPSWSGPSYSPPETPADSDAGIPASPTTLGGYDLAVLANADLATVRSWLDAHQYAYTGNDLDALTPYVSAGWTVTAVRVHVGSSVDHGALAPLSFTFEGSSIRLPIAISRDSSDVPAPITVYVAAEKRYDFPSVSGHVSFAQPVPFGGADYLTRDDLSVRFDVTADQDPVATASLNGNTQDVVTVTTVVHVPTTYCASNNNSSEGGCGCRLGTGDPDPALILFALVPLALLARRRRS